MIRLLENTRRPDITFNRNGRIFIAARVARLLSLAPGDALNIALNCNEISCQRAQCGIHSNIAECSRDCAKGEYLLYVIHKPFGRHEAQCYPTKQGSHNFCANSARLARALMDACNISTTRVAFMIGQQITIQETVYCPIITRYPL